MYHIEVREVYGQDQEYKPETAITGGKSFSRAKAVQKAKSMQRYSNSLHYKVVRSNR